MNEKDLKIETPDRVRFFNGLSETISVLVRVVETPQTLDGTSDTTRSIISSGNSHSPIRIRIIEESHGTSDTTRSIISSGNSQSPIRIRIIEESHPVKNRNLSV